MRIISGKLKWRRFELPQKNWKTRPTTDKARESLFNILSHRIDLEGLKVLDLFAGGGGVGYEFISRGAEKVCFVDKFGGCEAFIKKMLEEFNIQDFAEVQKADVFRYLQQIEEASYDIVFADPPYGLREMLTIPDIVFDRKILKKEGILIIEHDDRHNFENHTNFAEVRNYGQSIFSFFE